MAAPVARTHRIGSSFEHPQQNLLTSSFWAFQLFEIANVGWKHLQACTHTPTHTESRVLAATFAQPICWGFGNHPWKWNRSIGAKKLPAQLLATSPFFDAVKMQRLKPESIPNTPHSQRDNRQPNKLPSLGSKYMEQPDLPGQGRGDYAELGTVSPPDQQWHSSLSSHIQHRATLHLSRTRCFSAPALTDMYQDWMPSLSRRSNHVQTGFCSSLAQTTAN